jgi:sugar lactone lactonase YvrE
MEERMGRRFFLTAALLALALAAPLNAHPGSGIAVDRNGQVYFLDTGAGLWKVDAKGTVTRIPSPRFHWMALDAGNRFRSVSLPSGAGWEIARAGSNPTMLLASDFPMAIARDGNLYYPSPVDAASLDLMRLSPSGKRSVVAHVLRSHLNGLAAAPDGSLYYTEDNAVRRIAMDGTISTIATVRGVDGCVAIPGNERDNPTLRGLAVDADGSVYVAASGCGSVVKVSASGEVSKLLQINAPWSPTAVALRGKTVYVLEYLHTATEERLEWLPRVRKVSADGKQVMIANISR